MAATVETPAKPYPTVTPYLITSNSVQVVKFMRKVFDAKVVHIEQKDDGSVIHASLRIEESMVMLSEATEQNPAMPSMLYIYLDDCDKYYQRAIEAGGISLREPTNESYGDRSSGVKDMGDNQWWIAGPQK